MAGQLLLVNPRRRRRRKTASRKRRGPRRMSALQAKYFGKRRRKSNPVRRRSRHVARRTRRRSRRSVTSNPVSRYRRRHAVVRHRRRRRNPIGMSGITGPLMTAVYGTVGALATDVLFGVLPLPAQFKSGGMGTLAKAAVTIAGGMLAAKVVGRSAAERAVAGALTVQVYSFVKPLIAAAAPSIPGLGYYGAGYALSGINSPMNEYISNIPSSLNGLGRFVPNSLMGDDDDTHDYPGNDLSMYVPMR